MKFAASLAIAFASLSLAACNKESGVAGNDLTSANANDTAGAPVDNVSTANSSAPATAKAIVYSCKPAMTLSVRYDNDAQPDGKAILTLEDKEYALDHVQSGSGARYLTKAGRTQGASLVWWNKGRDGMLMEGSAADPAAEEKTIADCTEAG